MTRSRFRVAVLSVPLCLLGACANTESVDTNKVDASTGVSKSTQQPQEKVQLQEQQRKALLKKYLADAEEQRLKGNLETALLFLLQASQIAPGDRNIQMKLVSLRREMGKPGGAVDFNDVLTELRTLAQDRAITVVKDHLEAGKQLADEGNFGRAIERLRQADLLISTRPEVAWGNLSDQTKTLLSDTIARRNQVEQENDARALDEVRASRRAAEEALVARRIASRDRFLQTAQRAFQNRQFKLAQEFAQKALKVDPTSALAKNLSTAAGKSGRDQRTQTYFRKKSLEYLKMQQARAELMVPQIGVLDVDVDVARKALRRGGRKVPETVEAPEDRALRAKVATTMVPRQSFNEDNGAYAEVFKLLGTITTVPIIVTPEGTTVIDEESLVLTMNLASPLSLSNLLDEMVSKSETLAWTVKSGVVQITNKEKAGGNNRTSVLDVRAIVFPLTVFLPPRIESIPTDAESSTPRTGGTADEPVILVEPDALINNIKESTDPAYWEGDGPALEYLEGGYLLLTANPAMHRRVNDFLADLDRFSNSVVTIETKFLTIADNFLQETGFDFRGLGGTGNKGTVAPLDDVTNGEDDRAGSGLDNAGATDPAASPISGFFYDDGGDGDIRGRTENFFAEDLGRVLTPTGGLTAAITFLDDLEIQGILTAVEKSENSQVVNSQTVTVMNNGNANVAVINQTSYIRDFDVEVAQAAFIADPKVDVIHDGVVLDVRPVISHDRRSVLLVMNPTVAELTRPIPTLTTSLSGATIPVTLQLPELTVRSFATTANVPDGGSVLIGGLRQVNTKERRAEVPLLSQLPIISFFFKQEGVVDENQSLMVMVKAQITEVVADTDRALGR